MGFYTLLIKTVVRVVWPWILANVWPIIQSLIINIIAELLSGLVQKIRDFYGSKSKARSDQAEENAKSAESASDDEVSRAVAAVWREVAEHYRQDLEDMDKKVKALEEEAKKEASDKIGALKPVLSIDSEKPSLSIGESSHSLPIIK